MIRKKSKKGKTYPCQQKKKKIERAIVVLKMYKKSNATVINLFLER